MLEITKKFGLIMSCATCDKCGTGVTWHRIVSISRMEYIMRNKYRWKMGKQHLCEKCK